MTLASVGGGGRPAVVRGLGGTVGSTELAVGEGVGKVDVEGGVAVITVGS